MLGDPVKDWVSHGMERTRSWKKGIPQPAASGFRRVVWPVSKVLPEPFCTDWDDGSWNASGRLVAR